jgi:NAD(P)-dependent dehydrogenase (short-subunit alcohol dehydrogenase family)
MDLAGKSVVITGASSGIGRAAALAFADRHARLTLCSRNPAALEDLARECRVRGAEAIVGALDITDESAVERLSRQAVAAFGGIDIWVNAAAVLLLGPFEKLPADAFRRVIDTNLFGCVHASRCALRQFRAQGGRGVLINMSSMLGVMTEPHLTAYVATKFAIRGFTASLRQEVRDTPAIRICTILPAAIDTPIYQKAGNFHGKKARSIMPVYAVERVAQTIVRAAAGQGRGGEYLVGGFAWLLLFAQKISPSLLERLIARIGPRLQFEPQAEEGTTGNLFDSRAPHQADGGWRAYWKRRLRAAFSK